MCLEAACKYVRKTNAHTSARNCMAGYACNHAPLNASVNIVSMNIPAPSLRYGGSSDSKKINANQQHVHQQTRTHTSSKFGHKQVYATSTHSFVCLEPQPFLRSILVDISIGFLQDRL